MERGNFLRKTPVCWADRHPKGVYVHVDVDVVVHVLVDVDGFILDDSSFQLFEDR
jgi:hypothetical protein